MIVPSRGLMLQVSPCRPSTARLDKDSNKNGIVKRKERIVCLEQRKTDVPTNAWMKGRKRKDKLSGCNLAEDA